MKRLLSLFGISVLALSAATPSVAKTFFLQAQMDGAQANAGNGTGSPGTGVADVSYDDVSGELTWEVMWQGVVGDPTLMHFHGPATAGQNAGVVQGIGVASNPATGSAVITPAQAAELLQELWYVNLHTSAEPGGEIRGQVLHATFEDDFSGDLSNWAQSTRGLENNAPAGYDVPDTTGEQLTLGGTTSSQYWFGNSVESVADFDSRLRSEIRVKRVSLAGSGTAWRSSLWILGDDGHYLHYSQNVGETGWSYNARDDGGSGTLAPTGGGNNIAALDALDTDGGSFKMSIRLKPVGEGMVDVTLLHEGVEVATHSFTNFPPLYKVVLTGQARAANDSVSAVFDDLAVFQERVENLPPAFLTNPLIKLNANVGRAYSGTLAGDAIDPDEGDTITYSKTAGPGWLSVAADGGLSGTPASGDVGVNQFTVAASDGDGSDEATLVVRVVDPSATPGGTLFGWWPLNEGEGSAAADIGPDGVDANIMNVDTGGLGVGGTAWVEDPEGGMVLSFNGTDTTGTWAIVGNPPDTGTLPVLTVENEFTWSFWAKSEQAADTSIILGNRYSWTGVDFAPREFIKFTALSFEWDTNNVVGYNYDDIPQGVWMHHAIVKKGSELSYYRDGAFVGASAIAAAPANPQPLYFGGQGVENWRGYLTDIRLFSSALTSDDVLNAFNNKGVFTRAGGLAFTSIEVDGDKNVTLTWRSRSGAIYGLDYSNSLTAAGEPGGWAELDDGLESGGDTTTITLLSSSLPFLNTEPRLFFRVRELE